MIDAKEREEMNALKRENRDLRAENERLRKDLERAKEGRRGPGRPPKSQTGEVSA